MLTKTQLIALAGRLLTPLVENFHLANVLTHVAGAVAGVTPQRAADRGWDADERLKTRQVVPSRFRDERGEFGAATGPDMLSIDFNVSKGRRGQAHDDAGDRLVAD